MSLEEFIDRLGEETDRRRFIGKIGVAWPLSRAVPLQDHL
jgi:hypothetical protein